MNITKHSHIPCFDANQDGLRHHLQFFGMDTKEIDER